MMHIVQKCANFENFTGRDIDCIYLKKQNIDYKNIITLNRIQQFEIIY